MKRRLLIGDGNVVTVESRRRGIEVEVTTETGFVRVRIPTGKADRLVAILSEAADASRSASGNEL